MEIIIALWTFAEKNGPLSAFGLLCIVIASWWLFKKARMQWHRHMVGMAKLDDTHLSIIDPLTGEIVHRATLSTDVRNLHAVLENKMCMENCPVMPRIVETLEATTKLLQEFCAAEAKDRAEMKLMVRDNYDRMNERMDKSLAERDALLAQFITSFEHFANTSREKRKER